MSRDLQHRQWRELLGAYALGDLPAHEATPLAAHLEGCAACREELVELAPLADHLRDVDPARLGQPLVAPAGDLGQRIRSAVAEERVLVEARTARDRHRRRDRTPRRTAALLAAAAVVLGVGLAGGTLLGGAATPELSGLAGPGVPVEEIDLRAVGAGALDVEQAGLIAHTWGSEVRFEASGFDEGEVFRAAFRTRDGALLPAGEFVGTGDRLLLCNMQSAVLRDAAVEFVVTDAAGSTVLRSELPRAS